MDENAAETMLGSSLDEMMGGTMPLLLEIGADERGGESFVAYTAGLDGKVKAAAGTGEVADGDKMKDKSCSS